MFSFGALRINSHRRWQPSSSTITTAASANVNWPAQKLWWNGSAPLLYVGWQTRVDVLSCARGPDFWKTGDTLRYNPAETIETAGQVSDALQNLRERFSAARLSNASRRAGFTCKRRWDRVAPTEGACLPRRSWRCGSAAKLHQGQNDRRCRNGAIPSGLGRRLSDRQVQCADRTSLSRI